MATTRTTITDKAGRTIEVRSTKADYPLDPAFDSYLILHENGCDNHTLTLVLKLYLNQISHSTVKLPYVGALKLPFYPDADDKVFAIKPWNATDISAFKKQFLRQCTHWNDKFWLTPPAGFSGYDYKLGGRTVRPNIYCHLYVDVVASAADAHRSIDVVNLDRAAAARQLGKKVSDLDASDFRSHARLYDSLDNKPVPLPFDDDKGRTHKLNRSTIAHEVGHALGLPHIGVTHGAAQCQLAMVMDSLLPENVTSNPSYPALWSGASNSRACYGSSAPVSLGSNIMGYGLEFDQTNAKPWLDRIALHTATKAADWKVSVKKKVAPKFL